MKKIFSLALAAVMTASLATVAFAGAPAPITKFVLGKEVTAAPAVAEAVIVKDLEGVKTKTTSLAAEIPGGYEVYLPIMAWRDTGNSTIEVAELSYPEKDELKGYNVYLDWKVNGKNEKISAKIEYVKYVNGAGTNEYNYAIVVTLPKNTSTKAVDLAGLVKIAKTTTTAKNAVEGEDAFKFDTAYGETPAVAGTTSFSGGDLTSSGAVVSFDKTEEEIDIQFGEVALYMVNVNGQGDLNLKANTKYNSEIGSLFPAANLDFFTFEASPSFNRNGTMYLYGDADKFYYEVTKDGIRDLRGDYNEEYEAYEFKTRRLTSYVISDIELDTDTTITSSSSTPASSSSNAGSTGKPNPDTGR